MSSAPTPSEQHFTGSISAYFSAAPPRKTGIPYTNPRPDTFKLSPALSLRYSLKERTVIATPTKSTKLPREKPRISKGGSPALLTPAPPIIALLGAAQSSSSAMKRLLLVISVVTVREADATLSSIAILDDGAKA